MDSAGRKDTLFEAIGLMGKAFASPRRLELIDLLAQGSRSVEQLAYCRGPFCAYAHEAVRSLRAEGRSARRLEEGWPEWRLSKEETAA